LYASLLALDALDVPLHYSALILALFIAAGNIPEIRKLVGCGVVSVLSLRAGSGVSGGVSELLCEIVDLGEGASIELVQEVDRGKVLLFDELAGEVGRDCGQSFSDIGYGMLGEKEIVPVD